MMGSSGKSEPTKSSTAAGVISASRVVEGAAPGRSVVGGPVGVGLEELEDAVGSNVGAEVLLMRSMLSSDRPSARSW